MAYCSRCMKPVEGSFCGYCGKPVQKENTGWYLPVGTRLAVSGGWHTYEIGSLLGAGGFGVTYMAILMENGQRVAIKEYFPNKVGVRNPDNTVTPVRGAEQDFEAGLNNFLREAKMMAGLQSLPSVVKALDFFQANGTAYLVMEYLDGVSLSDKVQREGPIAPSALLPRLKRLMADMDFMHKQGLIHRDVSPDNIMWMPDGSLRLLDFGCARPSNSERFTETFKPGFAPVEQYQSKGQGPWTDVYGLAATIYYCFTGRIPPDAFGRLEEDTLRAPHELGIPLTPKQEAALMAGLSVQPSYRPNSIGAFADQLYAFSLGGAPIGGGPLPSDPGKPSSLQVLKTLWKTQKLFVCFGVLVAMVFLLLIILLIVL